MGGAFLPIMAQRRTMSFPQAPNTYTPHPLTGIIEGQHKRYIYIYIYNALCILIQQSRVW